MHKRRAFTAIAMFLAAAVALPRMGFFKSDAERTESERDNLEASLPMHRAAWEADAIRAAEARRAFEEEPSPGREAEAKRWEGIAAASRSRMESAHRSTEDARAKARELHLAAGTIPTEIVRKQDEIASLTVKLRAAEQALLAAEADAADCQRKYDRALHVRASRAEIPTRRRALHLARDRAELRVRERDEIVARLRQSRENVK